MSWHPLPAHCADVAACCEALLELEVLRRRLAALAELDDLGDGHRARLCVLAALHDVGKFNLGFQRKAVPDAKDTAGHVREVFALIVSRRGDLLSKFLEAIGANEVSTWGAERLLFAALAHHGAPVALEGGDLQPRPTIWRREGSLDPLAGMKDLAFRAREWFPACRDTAPPFPDEPRFQHAFSGLVTLADWIGSDERLFPYADEDAGERIAFARERAREALSLLGLAPSAYRGALEPRALDFDWLFRRARGLADFAPRPAQRAILDLPLPTTGSLDVLESETGSGKTEAALARFLALFAAGQVDGMYFALPTRTAATQIHDRVHRAVTAAFPDGERRPAVVLAVPGYLRVDEAVGRADPKLAPFRVLWPDDDADRWRFRGWAVENPKRYLAGCVVVGTIDQVLLSALAVKHAHVRATPLLRHLLVVDEVHASDAYMNRILEAVLEHHLAAGGHALLMSATLGSAARERFTSSDRAVPSLEQAIAVPYPCITHVQAIERRSVAVDGQVDGKTVLVDVSPLADDFQGVALRGLGAAREGARVIILRNTVRDALATQEALEQAAGDNERALLFTCAGRPAPHHSRFARGDRVELDAAIEAQMGRAARCGPCIAVATQTVQQSLDLDADLLLTDLCPMDVLLQRIGRLHRHVERARPTGFEAARLVLLVSADRDLGRFIRARGRASGTHGIGTVYPDLRVLEATWRLALSHPIFEIPRMNRELVEGATHPEALAAIVRELGDRWEEHRNNVIGESVAQGVLASTNMLDWSKPFGDQGLPSGLDVRIKTRLGAGDRLARFESPFRTAFSVVAAELTIPAWLVTGAEEDARPEDVTIAADQVRFRFGRRRFIYDRFGLRPESTRPRDHEEDLADA